MTNTDTMKIWRVRILGTTWLSYAGFYFCRKNFSQVKGSIMTEFQIDEIGVAHIWTAYLVAYMLGQFMTSFLGQKKSARILLLSGMGITLLVNIMFGFNVLMGPAGYYPMIVLMIINGFAQATGWPGNVGILGNWLKRDERGKIMGAWATSYQIGSILAKTLASIMLVWLGLSWSFWGASMVMFAIWILFYLFEKDKPEDAGLDPIIEEIEVVIPKEKLESHKKEKESFIEGWTTQVMLSVFFIGITYFVFKFCRYALDSWGPLIIQTNFKSTFVGMSAKDAEAISGLITTTFDWVGFTGVLFAGWASDYFFKGRRHQITLMMSIGMFISLAMTAWIGLSSIYIFAALLAVTGFMLMGPDSLLSGAGAIDVGGKSGAIVAAGIINGLGSIGPIVQEQVIPRISTSYGVMGTFVLLIFVAFLGVLGTAFLSYRSRKGLSTL